MTFFASLAKARYTKLRTGKEAENITKDRRVQISLITSGVGWFLSQETGETASCALRRDQGISAMYCQDLHVSQGGQKEGGILSDTFGTFWSAPGLVDEDNA